MKANYQAAERAMVQRTLEEIIARAELLAHLVAAFLQHAGLRANTTTSSGESDIDSRANQFLLDLGAALQIQQWERLGFRAYLPANIPTGAEAFIVAADNAAHPEAALASDTLAKDVFRTWFNGFARHSQATHMGEVLIASNPDEQLLDELAELLWTHRNTIPE